MHSDIMILTSYHGNRMLKSRGPDMQLGQRCSQGTWSACGGNGRVQQEALLDLVAETLRFFGDTFWATDHPEGKPNGVLARAAVAFGSTSRRLTALLTYWAM